jgi:putative NADH-flavin reductase
MIFLLRKLTFTIIILFGVLILSSCLSPNITPDPRTTHSPDPTFDATPNQHKTIAVLGGTGMVGRFLLEEALEKGFRVRALARTPKKLEYLKDRLTVVTGNALDPSAIDNLLQGSDIVISALGPVKADGRLAKYLSTDVTAHLVKSMQKHNIKRYIVVSGGAVKMPGDERNLTGWLIEKLASIRYHDTLTDKQAEYQLLAGSNLEWTIVRCPLIENKTFRRAPKASLLTLTSFYLRAGDLAQFIIEQISSDEFIRKGPFLESQ